MSREEESDSKNIKWTQDVRGKPQEMDENPRFEQERIILALFSFVLYGKRGNPLLMPIFGNRAQWQKKPNNIKNVKK